jgi:hypothetical protein
MLRLLCVLFCCAAYWSFACCVTYFTPQWCTEQLHHRKNRKMETIKSPKSKKLIYNDELMSTNDDVCSKIDPLYEKKMLPEDDPVRSKHVVDIF